MPFGGTRILRLVWTALPLSSGFSILDRGRYSLQSGPCSGDEGFASTNLPPYISGRPVSFCAEDWALIVIAAIEISTKSTTKIASVFFLLPSTCFLIKYALPVYFCKYMM